MCSDKYNEAISVVMFGLKTMLSDSQDATHDIMSSTDEVNQVDS